MRSPEQVRQAAEEAKRIEQAHQQFQDGAITQFELAMRCLGYNYGEFSTSLQSDIKDAMNALVKCNDQILYGEEVNQ